MLQTEALDILKMGHNVYLTGAAGSGKTYVINQYIKYLKDHSVSVGVTASTGIAATHMNGMTIHSWAGICILDDLTKDDLKRLKKKSKLKRRLEDTKVLIIDEVSMLHGKRLDMVDQVCRAFKDKEKPFGGLQVVLSGDLFQLPPVTKSGSVDFVFESKAWNNMNLKICYLTEQYRQEDERLLDVLSAIRTGSVDDNHFEYLNGRFIEPAKNTEITKLFTHNASVDSINNDELEQLTTEQHNYYMRSTGNSRIAEGLMQSCLAPETLSLKVGAKVMFVANNPAEGFVNGTMGEVSGFDEEDNPIVQTELRTVYVKQHSWSMDDGDRVLAQISQLPLRLAWAITVHKSQGMSLDSALVDLAESFEPGMGYVALSRVRTLEGLYIKGLNNTALMINPIVAKLDASLMSKSQQAKTQLKKIKKKELDLHHNRVRLALRSDEAKWLDNYDNDLFEELKKWRTKQAAEQSVPAYVVLPDKTLKLIAAIKPKDKTQLSKISGIGKLKLEKYHKDILKMTGTVMELPV